MTGIVLNIPSPAALFEVALVSIRMNFGKVQMPSKHKMSRLFFILYCLCDVSHHGTKWADDVHTAQPSVTFRVLRIALANNRKVSMSTTVTSGCVQSRTAEYGE